MSTSFRRRGAGGGARKGSHINVEMGDRNEQSIKFKLTDCDISVANALRRILIAEVPTVAIDFVEVTENNSVLHDNFLAHRLGLVPLTSETADGMKYARDCTCDDPPCVECGVRLTLHAECTTNETLEVTSFDLVSNDDQVRPVGQAVAHAEDQQNQAVLLCKLQKGQQIKMDCVAKKGIGKEHAKWSPVSCATFKCEPIVELNEDALNDLTLADRTRIKDSCPTDVFDIEDGKLMVKDATRCMFCNECTRTAESVVAAGGAALGGGGGGGGPRKPPVVIGKDETKFEFVVETVGSIAAEKVVQKALDVLSQKLKHLLHEIPTL